MRDSCKQHLALRVEVNPIYGSTHYVSSLSMHSAMPTCQPPFMVRSLQLVEVRPYAEEENGDKLKCARYVPPPFEIMLPLPTVP